MSNIGYSLPIQYNYTNGEYQLGFFGRKKLKNGNSVFNIVDDKKNKLVGNIELNEKFLHGEEAINNIFIKIDHTDIMNLIDQHCTEKEFGKDYYTGKMKYHGYFKNNKYHGKNRI